MAQQRLLESQKIRNYRSPSAVFHLDLHNSVHICNATRRTKKPQEPIPTMQQEVGHFEFTV